MAIEPPPTPDFKDKIIDDLQKVIENIHWLLQQEMSDEAMKHLRAYVSRKVTALKED